MTLALHQSTNRRRIASLPPLNALEYAGWAVVAGEVLKLHSGEAKALRAMVFAAGRYISPKQVRSCFGSRRQRSDAPDRTIVSPAISRLRRALEDVGLPRHAVENDADAGYAIAPHHARTIRNIVEAA